MLVRRGPSVLAVVNIYFGHFTTHFLTISRTSSMKLHSSGQKRLTYLLHKWVEIKSVEAVAIVTMFIYSVNATKI